MEKQSSLNTDSHERCKNQMQPNKSPNELLFNSFLNNNFPELKLFSIWWMLISVKFAWRSVLDILENLFPLEEINRLCT